MHVPCGTLICEFFISLFISCEHSDKMLRTGVSQLKLIRPYHRNLTSSVLLTRTYDNESVAELKKLAKDRGLSPYVMAYSLLLSNKTQITFNRKGNKSTLITRIQEHDQSTTLKAVSSSQQDPPVPVGVTQLVRRASSAAPATSGSEKSGPVPGIPPAAQPKSQLASTAFTNINLPDLSQPDAEIPTPIVRVFT